jgi:inward rectifier potassium channel
VAKAKAQQLLDSRGRLLIERRGVKTAFARDIYHFLRTTSWTRIMGLFATLFIVTNLVFALILYVGHARVMNAHDFVDYFWFSVQTLATIGYGNLAPADSFANAIVLIESFIGIILSALITGIFFARFSTPSPRVLFSRVAIISTLEGKRVMQFRMANERATAIVEATARVYLTRDEKLASGEQMRRVYDLPLRRSTSPVFALSFLAVHSIDEASPLHNQTADDLRANGTNIVITLTGIDDRLAATVHTRYIYTADDIVFDQRFADLFKRDPETGTRYLDLGPLHETIPQ